MPSRTVHLALSLLLLLTFLSVVSDAQSSSSGEAGSQASSTSSGTVVNATAAPNISTRRPVYIDISINKLEKVNGVEQTFSADFYLTMFYQEPALGFNVTAAGMDGKRLSEDQLRASELIDIEFTNAADVRAAYQYHVVHLQAPEGLRHFTAPSDDPTTTRLNGTQSISTVNGTAGVTSGAVGSSFSIDGISTSGAPWIAFDSRMIGQFKASLPLHNFPFDDQKIELPVESSNFDVSSCHFVIAVQTDFITDMDTILGWDILGAGQQVKDHYYTTFDETYSRATFEVRLKRHSGYYRLRIISGIILLVVMSLLLFVLEVHDSNRLTVSATIFLALIAFMFIVAGDVPKISYTTTLDRFITFSMIFVFIVYASYSILYLCGRLARKLRHKVEEEVAKEEKEMTEDFGSEPVSPAQSRKRRQQAVAQRLPCWIPFWDRNIRRIDLSLLLCLVLLYVIGAPIVLTSRLTND